MRVLWVGAHPDDELFVACWLGSLLEKGAQIGFLVATRGERGPGLLPVDDPEHIASVREEEMRRAAALFGSEVMFLELPDGTAKEPEAVLRTWAERAGGAAALRERFRSKILQFRPDRIVTFDRRHGCTWHADHRAVAKIVQRLALPIPVTLAESRTDLEPPVRFVPGIADALRVDARDTWHWLVRTMECHESQFSPELLALVRDVPEEERAVWLQHLPRWRSWHHGAGNVVRVWQQLKSHVRDRLRR